MNYDWRPDWRPPGLQAQEAGEELRRIREKRGVLTAEIIVEESRPPEALLHDAIFHINDREAAQRYYESRASAIVRAVIVLREDEEQPRVRAFQFVVTDEHEEGSYVPSEEVAASPDLSEQVRGILIRKIAHLHIELEGWEEFSGIRAAIAKALTT